MLALTLLPICLPLTFLVLPFKVGLTDAFLPSIFIFLLCTSPLAIVLLLLVHPLAFALLVLDAPVATALKVFTLPVMVLFLVIKCPLGMQTGVIHALLMLDAHYLSYRVAFYLVVSESIFESSYFVIFNKTALLDIDECLIFFFLALCFTQALLGVEQQYELLHLVVVQQLVAV